MLTNKVIRLQEKIFSCPGFFEGIIDAKIEFDINSKNNFLIQWKKIETFLRVYNIEGLSVNKQGELINVVFPFSTDEDIELAKYVFEDHIVVF